MKITARIAEQKILAGRLASSEPELIAISYHDHYLWLPEK